MSSATVAANLPSDATAHPFTPPVCPRKTASSAPVSGSQIRTVVSSPTEMRSRPSALTAQPHTQSVWPRSTWRVSPVGTDQIRTVVSSLADASQLPSGAAAQQLTRPLCPVRIARVVPSVVFQMRTVVSALPDASHDPSGAIAHPQTASRWPIRRRRCAGCGWSGSGHRTASRGPRRRAARSAHSGASAAISDSWASSTSVSECSGAIGESRCALWVTLACSARATSVAEKEMSAAASTGPRCRRLASSQRRSATQPVMLPRQTGISEVVGQVAPKVERSRRQRPPRTARAGNPRLGAVKQGGCGRQETAVDLGEAIGTEH